MRVCRRTVSCAPVVLLVVSSIGSVANAGPTWRHYGPDGGFVAAVAVDPTNPSAIYASPPGGMFKSTNGGASWFDASVGMAHHDMAASSIVVDPSDSNVAYAANGQTGVYKTTNGGATWSIVNNGLPPFGGIPFALAVDPSAPSTLYVGLLDSGVYKSTDGASSWSPASTGLPAGTPVYALAIDARSPSTLWASLDAYGVYRTTDGGATWNPANAGLPPGVQGLALVSSAAKPSQLYLGSLDDGVFRSTNGGGSWHAVNDSLPFLYTPTVAVSPGDANAVFTVSGSTPYRSSDGGGTWHPAVTPPAANVVRMAVDPLDPTILYAATENGMSKSENRGKDWSAINVGFTASELRAVAIDPVTSTTAFAATASMGVFKSTDGTTSWTAVNDGVSSLATTGIVIDPSDPNTVYASTGAGISKTVNGGASWTNADSGIPGGAGCIAIDPGTPATLYACTATGVYKTTNGGGTWSPATTGIPVVQIWILVIDPASPATVYAATSGGVYKTVDGGGSWNPMNTGFVSLDINALAIDPVTPTTLYAGGVGSRIYTTTNGGTNWTQTDTVSGVLSLAVDPTTPGTVYAGSYGGGVLRSTTSATDFSPVNYDGLSSWVVVAVTVDGSGTPYAGTFSGGVFTLTDCGNGTPEVGEQCDDGNETSGDGCSATCTLEPCGAAPAAFCRVAVQAQLQLGEKTPGKERLKVSWKKVAGTTTLADFGDPVGGTTRAVLCLYDDGGALIASYQVDRAGDMCGTKPCWAPKGSTGLGYRDKSAAASGITKMGFKAGATLRAKADMAGANNAAKGQTALPAGVVAALSGNDAPTMQLFTSDGLCIGATMTTVTKDDGLQYKAKK